MAKLIHPSTDAIVAAICFGMKSGLRNYEGMILEGCLIGRVFDKRVGYDQREDRSDPAI